MKEAALVECITCGRQDGWTCRNGKGKDVDYFHLQRKLLWILRQKHPYGQLFGKREEGYREEQTRLRALLNVRISKVAADHKEFLQDLQERKSVLDYVCELEEL